MITINAEIVETIEETPDTVITLTNGKKYIVQESLDEVIKLIIEYKRSIFYKYIEKI
jgi:flagellar protein FlbD